MRNLLIKLASKIIKKYGTFEVDLHSKIRFHDMVFIVNGVSLNMSNVSVLNIECGDTVTYYN